MKSLDRHLKSGWQLFPRSTRDRIRRNRTAARILELVSSATISGANHDEIYDGSYYDFVDNYATAAAPAMAGALVATFTPRTLVDLGCGSGAFLAAVQALGVDCTGVDNSLHAVETCVSRGLRVRLCDLRDPDPDLISHRYDIATSFEVAEHLPETLADVFVNLLCRFSPLVALTAASPGQGGMNHVNEQPHDYWIGKFAARDYELDQAATDQLRAHWRAAGTAYWYHCNLLIFRARPHPGPTRSTVR